jgi:inorganic pyrophosphatase
MAKKYRPDTAYNHIEPYRKSGNLNVISETPKGSRNKFKYNEELGIFELGSVLPSGAMFPFDFGFVPGTMGEDGDPLDVLVLMDEPAFPGCLVHSRLIGVIEAEQTEKGETTRNDRLVAVASNSRNHKEVTSIHQLSDNLVEEIQHFFKSYNEMKGKEFKPLGCYAVGRAHALIEEGVRAYRERG